MLRHRPCGQRTHLKPQTHNRAEGLQTTPRLRFAGGLPHEENGRRLRRQGDPVGVSVMRCSPRRARDAKARQGEPRQRRGHADHRTQACFPGEVHSRRYQVRQKNFREISLDVAQLLLLLLSPALFFVRLLVLQSRSFCSVAAAAVSTTSGVCDFRHFSFGEIGDDTPLRLPLDSGTGEQRALFQKFSVIHFFMSLVSYPPCSVRLPVFYVYLLQ